MTTYIYGIMRSDHPLPISRLVGVGALGPPLRPIRYERLAAVVSDAPEGLRPKRRDVEAHERVVETLCAAGTVLPMQFGLLAQSDAAVTAELASRAERYLQLLDRLDGQVEVNLKGRHREDALLADLLRRNEELREQNAALQAAGGGSQPDKVSFGRLVAQAIEQRSAQDGDRAVARLMPYASQVRLGPAVAGCFVNVSFLLTASRQDEFEAAVAQLRDDTAGYADLIVYGPLPPYSFVAD